MRTPVRLRVPEKCPACHRRDGMRVETTVRGDSVSLAWYCSSCSHEWPVIRADEEPPRPLSGPPVDGLSAD